MIFVLNELRSKVRRKITIARILLTDDNCADDNCADGRLARLAVRIPKARSWKGTESGLGLVWFPD